MLNGSKPNLFRECRAPCATPNRGEPSLAWSPSPRPSPPGRGRNLFPLAILQRAATFQPAGGWNADTAEIANQVSDYQSDGGSDSLSLRERAGVRGNRHRAHSTCRTADGTVELPEILRPEIKVYHS